MPGPVVPSVLQRSCLRTRRISPFRRGPAAYLQAQPGREQTFLKMHRMNQRILGNLRALDPQARRDRPAFDPELRAGLAIVGGMFPPTVTSDLIDFMRVSYAGPALDTLIGGRSIRCEERVFEGYGGHELKASVFRHEQASGRRPGVLFVHSGGLMFGDRFSGLDRMID